MRQPKVGDKVTIHKWHYEKIKLPQKGEILDVNGSLNTPYEIRIEIDHDGCTNASWWFREDEFTIDEEEPILRDREGRPLKKFEEGKWYTNPLYQSTATSKAGFAVKYFRVKSVSIKKATDGTSYNVFKFDALADENWENIKDLKLTQSNCDFDQQMKLVENPYAIDIHQAVKQVQTESNYYDGFSLVGRYVQAKKDTCFGVKAGEYLLIENEDLDHWFIEKYLSCTKYTKCEGYLTNIFNLMPEGFVPPSKSPKIDMEDIQRQCKEKYPIGSRVKSTSGYHHVIEQDDTVYAIRGNHIHSTLGWGLLYNNGKWAEVIELPKAVKASSSSKAYVPLPLPEDKSNIVYWEVVEDIPENSVLKLSGNPFTHPFIPRGTITWTRSYFHGSSTIYIEDNRWSTNFPKELFRVLDTNITTEPTVGIQPVVDSKAFISSTSSTVVIHQADTKPPIKENPSPIRTINTIQTKLKNKKVRL